MVTLIDSVMLTVLAPSVLIVLGSPGRNEVMFNDKMLLPPALDEVSEGCVDLEGGWLVMTPSPLEFDELVGTSVADALIRGSMDKLGGTVVDEPIGRSMEKNGDSVADELVGNGRSMDKIDDSAADELGGDRRSDKIGFKSGSSALVDVDDRRASLF
jgi:hypothetical protein